MQARWPVLVLSLVANGVDVAEAETAVARVLARLRPGWSRLARDEDADVRVWADIRAEAGLPPDHGAVAPVLDDPDLIQSTADVTVSPQPLELIEDQTRQRRRTVLRGVAVAAVAVVIVGVYLAWATTRAPAPDVVVEANPAPVPWYAEGRLHLQDVSVELPRLDRFVVTGDDEVTYRDTAGRWFTVSGDGDVEAAPAPDAPESSGGVRVSHDQRYVVRLREGGASAYYPDGGAFAYDRTRRETLDSGVRADRRVLDATFAPDGTVTYVISNQYEDHSADTAVRLSETGTLSLRTCALVPLECHDVVRVSGSTGSLRLR
ncbi:hypothetical protein [Nocardioides sp. InS609-2]|uniref:hypothetical protein n=1 Tax=Nocardioides sp. InS609-2 TaxID=2760705 RepID=UPI0020BF6F6E|nr:hypothetical protein [Nocardioides sp. InS609-2]